MGKDEMSFEPHFDLDLRGGTFPLSRERLLLLNVDHDVFGTFSSFFHFDRSMRLHFRYEKFPPSSSLLSSLRGSSPRELSTRRREKAPLCSPGKNLIPFHRQASLNTLHVSHGIRRVSLSLPSFLYFRRSINPTVRNSKIF